MPRASTINDTESLAGASEFQPAPAPQTIQQLTTAAALDLQKAEARRKRLHAELKAQDKVPVYLSPMYQAYFGKMMPIFLSGFPVYFRVDGSVQYLPKAYADIVDERRMNIDNMLNKQARMASVVNNLETYPGEIKF